MTAMGMNDRPESARQKSFYRIDSTADLVSNFPLTVCRSPKGRSRQMNAGVAVARGEILYFLYAETLPPETFVDDIRSAVASGKKADASE